MRNLELLSHLETYLTDHRKARFNAVLSQRTRHFTVAIEDVYQLHNTSAVVRSCDVFGIQDVHIIEEINRKRLDREIALGAQKWVDLYRYTTTNDCLKSLKEKGYQIVATTPHADDCDLQNFDISKRSCFFFGREAGGLSQQVLDQADCYLKIPMVGFTESLNISVSAAIILQHVSSKLRASDHSWRLSEEEKIDIRFDWISKTIKTYDAIVERFLSQS